MDQNALYGSVPAIVVSAIWGLSFVAASAVLSTLTPILLATIRFSIASLVFIPIIVWEFKHGRVVKLRDLMELALLGVLSVSVYFWLQYTGIKYAGAGISALLVVGLIPILTGVASFFALKETYALQQLLGTALGLFGVALITVPGLLLNKVDWLFYLGVLCLLLNAICWALYSTLSRRLMNRTRRPLMNAACVTVFGTIALIPMSLTSEWSSIASLRPEQWLSILYLSLVCSCGGYYLWNLSLSRMEAMKVTVWQYLEPPVAFMGEALIFNIMPSPTVLIGATAIIAGALLTNWVKKA
ncbi:MAG: DMT family transporter [Candidatus Bathyarchaeia archaeon]